MSFTRLFSCLYVFYISAYGFIAEKYVYLQVMKGRKFQQEKERQVQVKEGKETGYGKEKTAGSTGL